MRRLCLSTTKWNAFIAVMIAFTFGCDPQVHPNADSPKLTLSYVQKADPAKDAAEEISRKNIYFVGLTEMGERLPGTESHDEFTKKYPSRYVEGTSDTNPTNEEERADQYAEIFNLTIVRYLTGKN